MTPGETETDIDTEIQNIRILKSVSTDEKNARIDLEITSQYHQETRVELLEPVPAETDPNQVGFRPQNKPDDAKIREDGTFRVTLALSPWGQQTVVYGIKDIAGEQDVLVSEPELSGVFDETGEPLEGFEGKSQSEIASPDGFEATEMNFGDSPETDSPTESDDAESPDSAPSDETQLPADRPSQKSPIDVLKESKKSQDSQAQDAQDGETRDAQNSQAQHSQTQDAQNSQTHSEATTASGPDTVVQPELTDQQIDKLAETVASRLENGSETATEQRADAVETESVAELERRIEALNAQLAEFESELETARGALGTVEELTERVDEVEQLVERIDKTAEIATTIDNLGTILERLEALEQWQDDLIAANTAHEDE